MSVRVCSYCHGRETLDCPRCAGSRYELVDPEDHAGAPRFIRPATQSEYLRQVRETTRKRRHAYRESL